MTAMKPRVDRIAYIGWRGIDGCEILDLDKGPLTGLVGPSGAGKSTLVMCLDYALLPDRKVLDIRPISEVQDSQKAGVDSLAERIDPRYGYAYVALDITTRVGSRLVAGIYVDLVEGRADFTRWLIRDAQDIPLRSILGQEEGEHEFFPPFAEFKRHCASRGLDVTTCRSVGEYGQALYEAGILPSSMAIGQDRKLYANLIETTFRGGVSNQVVSRLKDYLLPEATQVPEIVRGLQECANEVIMTRSAVAVADKELSLLQSTYGVGKEIVLHSLRWMTEVTNNVRESLRIKMADLANMKATQKHLSDDTPRLKDEIQQTEETKKAVLKAAVNELGEISANATRLTATLSTLNLSLATAKANKNTFDQGRKLWQEIVGQHANQSIEWAGEWLDNRRKRAARDVFENESKMDALQEEGNRLNSGMASALSEKLAEKTGGQTLEDKFGSVSEHEAFTIELSLCGLTDGVVGIEVDTLAGLPASDNLPDTFWLGMEPPKSLPLRATGDWYVSPMAGGYIATKNGRSPVFGSAARAARQKAILKEIDDFRLKHKELSLDAEKLEQQKNLLVKHGDSIAYYLTQRENITAIDKSVMDAEEAINSCKKEIAEAERLSEETQGKIQEIGKPYEAMLLKLRGDLSGNELKLSTLERGIDELVKSIADDEEKFAELQVENASAKDILGDDYELMLKATETLEHFNVAKLPVEQTKRISALGVALQDEVPGRLAILQEADPNNRLTTLNLWPILMEIVRERVSIDRAEVGSEDMIQVMKEHRADLDSQLVLHENEVRIRARNIFQTISSLVVSQQRKIDKLSKLGADIQFGNVVGIRIVLSPRKEMLSVLEGFAEQLFSEKKPVDAALKEWFAAASSKKEGISLSGEELLDYRNYVDISIEACRKGSGWAPAASLSGGEAIGCGLAMALMLTRSIAAKGDIKADQISPLFAVDEVHRLDGPGQAMIVNFAEREQFQVIVTASSLSPDYSCILYALNRVFDPTERLIIRGMKITEKKKAA